VSVYHIYLDLSKSSEQIEKGGREIGIEWERKSSPNKRVEAIFSGFECCSWVRQRENAASSDSVR